MSDTLSLKLTNELRVLDRLEAYRKTRPWLSSKSAILELLHKHLPEMPELPVPAAAPSPAVPRYVPDPDTYDPDAPKRGRPKFQLSKNS